MPTITITSEQSDQTILQTTQHLLMIEPVSFAYNDTTAVNNHFQSKTSGAQPKALTEFLTLVELLKSHGVTVIVIKDTLLPHTPDSIFPSNAVSFHKNGRAYLYPMYAPNRRSEINHDILYAVKGKGFVLKEIYDMRPVVDSGVFLEGTGSMVLDRRHRVAYACQSARTSKEWFTKTTKRLDYRPVLFTAKHNVLWKRLPIYHTNLMLSIAETFVLVCLAAVDDDKQRKHLQKELQATDREIIEISEKQVHAFVGNAKQVRTNNPQSPLALVMSTTAYDSLTPTQIARIEQHCPIVHSDLSTIEENGGGSVGCMMAEIFLPRRKTYTAQATIKSKNKPSN